MSIETPEIYARIYAAHGHRCPMSTLGGRIGLAAVQRLGAFDPAQLQAVYHARTCAADGIALTLGCSEANGQLTIGGNGRHCLEVKLPGYRFAAEISQRAMQLAGSYRQLANRLEAGWETLSKDEQQCRTAEMEAALDKLLPQLWDADEAELLCIDEVADA